MKQMRHIRTGIHSVLMFHVGASDIKLAPTFFAKVRARSRRCSSFPNRTLCAGLRFGFGHESESFIMYSAWIFHVAAKCTLRPRLFCNQYKSTLLHSPPFKIDSILLPVFS